ncbi:hypothetical protein FQR65_LT20202 [Abscondita terminalis]|nr:hypothetical protein FQR65_LT20202 [Abscondita terminalis]
MDMRDSRKQKAPTCPVSNRGCLVLVPGLAPSGLLRTSALVVAAPLESPASDLVSLGFWLLRPASRAHQPALHINLSAPLNCPQQFARRAGVDGKLMAPAFWALGWAASRNGLAPYPGVRGALISQASLNHRGLLWIPWDVPAGIKGDANYERYQQIKTSAQHLLRTYNRPPWARAAGFHVVDQDLSRPQAGSCGSALSLHFGQCAPFRSW